MYSADLSTATVTHTKPRFHPRFPKPAEKPKHLARRTCMWIELDELDQDVSILIGHLNQISQSEITENGNTSTTCQGLPTEEYGYISFQAQKLLILYRFIESLMQRTKNTKETQSCKQRPFILAGYIYFHNHFQIPNSSQLVILSPMISELKESLQGLGIGSIAELRPELFFWLLFVGGSAASSDSSKSWFQLRLAEVSQKLFLLTWSDAKAVLRDFAWVESPMDSEHESFWTEVQAINEDVNMRMSWRTLPTF